MAQHRHVILVCDLCGVEEPNAVIDTHRVTVDGRTRDAEACESCWAGLMGVFAQFAHAGREPEKRKVKKSDIQEWPGTTWKFTHHAMQRMGERRLSMTQILRTLASPVVTRPGDNDGDEIWERDLVKVVVHPEKELVYTVARVERELAEAS